jgi:formylglycine-generating enzyme required for sulfatase activity
LANYDGDYTYGEAPKGVSRRKTVEVRSFPANAFGLYEMHGNVWEWCADQWNETYEGAPLDGSAWLTRGRNNDNRSLRGGSWDFASGRCRSASRMGIIFGFNLNLCGFRVACVAPETL